MNGYVVIGLATFFVAALWFRFGHFAGIFALCYVAAMNIALVKYNNFVKKVIITMREEIESLTGRPYTGPAY